MISKTVYLRSYYYYSYFWFRPIRFHWAKYHIIL